MNNKTWRAWLREQEKTKPFKQQMERVNELRDYKLISPADETLLFRSLKMDVSDLKLVLVGDCPPREPVFADGYAFSSYGDVERDTTRLYQQIYDSIGVRVDPNMPHKQRWVDQGVMLLNRMLTGDRMGWKTTDIHRYWLPFTHDVLFRLSQEEKPMVFMFLDRFEPPTFQRGRPHLVLTKPDFKQAQSFLYFNRGGTKINFE